MDFIKKRRNYYQYFKGIGLDVGPFDKPFLDPRYAKKHSITVEYVDLHTPKELKEIFNEIPNFHPVSADYIYDVSQNGFGFNKKQYDFIILSHVLEHVINPFRLVKEGLEKLKPGGILYIGLPDERYSDDKGRRLTEYDELLKLFRKNEKEISDERVINYLNSPVIAQVPWVKKLIKQGNNFSPEQLDHERQRSFHVHVWNSGTALQQFVNFVKKECVKANLIDIDVWENNGYETVMVFQKPVATSTKTLKEVAKKFRHLLVRPA